MVVHRQLSTASEVKRLQDTGQESLFQTDISNHFQKFSAGEALLTSSNVKESLWKFVCRSMKWLKGKSKLSIERYFAHLVSKVTD